MLRSTAAVLALSLAAGALAPVARADDAAPAATKKVDLLAVGAGGGGGNDPLFACGLSCCVPGAGQCYNGEYPKALGLFAAAVGLNLVGQLLVVPQFKPATTSTSADTRILALPLLLGAVSLGLTVFAMYDAYTTAQNMGAGSDGRVQVIRTADAQ